MLIHHASEIGIAIGQAIAGMASVAKLFCKCLRCLLEMETLTLKLNQAPEHVRFLDCAVSAIRPQLKLIAYELSFCVRILSGLIETGKNAVQFTEFKTKYKNLSLG